MARKNTFGFSSKGVLIIPTYDYVMDIFTLTNGLFINLSYSLLSIQMKKQLCLFIQGVSETYTDPASPH